MKETEGITLDGRCNYIFSRFIFDLAFIEPYASSTANTTVKMRMTQCTAERHSGCLSHAMSYPLSPCLRLAATRRSAPRRALLDCRSSLRPRDCRSSMYWI